MAERPTPSAEREVSRGHSSCHAGTKGRRSGRVAAVCIEFGMSQMFAQAKLAGLVDRVKPDRPRQRETEIADPPQRRLRRQVGCVTNLMTSTTPTARCGPACQVVWEGLGQVS